MAVIGGDPDAGRPLLARDPLLRPQVGRHAAVLLGVLLRMAQHEPERNVIIFSLDPPS